MKPASPAFAAFLAGSKQFVMWEVYTFTLADASTIQYSTRDGPVPTANAPVGSDYVLDTFTGIIGTTLTTHVGETGAVWSPIFGANGPEVWVLNGAGNVLMTVTDDADPSYVGASGVIPSGDFNMTLRVALPNPIVRPSFLDTYATNLSNDDVIYVEIALNDGTFAANPDSVGIFLNANGGSTAVASIYYPPSGAFEDGESFDLVMAVSNANQVALLRSGSVEGEDGVIAFTQTFDANDTLPVPPFTFVMGTNKASAMLISTVEVGPMNSPVLLPYVRDFFNDPPGMTLDVHGPITSWSPGNANSSAVDWLLTGSGSVFLSAFQPAQVSSDLIAGGPPAITPYIPDGTVAPVLAGFDLITPGPDLGANMVLQLMMQSDTTPDGLFLLISLFTDATPDEVRVDLTTGNDDETVQIIYNPPGDHFNGPVAIYACMAAGHNAVSLLIDGALIETTITAGSQPQGNLLCHMVWSGAADTGLLIDTIDVRPLEQEP